MMRLSLFNTFATPVAFGAQRPVARAVRFGETDTTKVQEEPKYLGHRDIFNEAWVRRETAEVTNQVNANFQRAADLQAERALKTKGDPDEGD
ncbi:MAG: hypothetical protein QE263_09970 [Vampirovibrionales bacterium]|nr:hypothetical protein [Vampirovibrionales bacterium]